MNTTLRKDADQIIAASLKAVLPDEAVFRALKSFRPGTGRTLLVAAGKAAWQMANAAVKVPVTVLTAEVMEGPTAWPSVVAGLRMPRSLPASSLCRTR